ncbi:MAG: hypothetical protein ABI614_22595, partial [Planctomycetota bacterium]
MTRERMRFDQLLTCVVIALMIAASTSGEEETEAKPGLSQWAIIATGDAETSGVADLLMAELSSRPD